MKRPQTNWIIDSGQIWKLYVALAGFGATFICFGMAILSLGTGAGQVTALSTLGLLLGIVSFCWLNLAIRCPHCLTKLVWTMAKTRPHSSWLIELGALESCPACKQPLGQKTRPGS